MWDVDEVNARLQKIMVRAFHEMVDTMRKHHVPPRAGAMILAVGRVSEATLVAPLPVKGRGRLLIFFKFLLRSRLHARTFRSCRSFLDATGIFVLRVRKTMSTERTQSFGAAIC